MSLFLLACPLRAAESARAFAIPAGDARTTLAQFIEQSAEQIVCSPQLVRDVRTRAVEGRFEPSAALRRMLEGTSLVVLHDVSTGALSLARTAPPSAAPAVAAPAPGARRTAVAALVAWLGLVVAPLESALAAAPAAAAQTGPAPAASAAKDEALVLNAFTVSEQTTKGYAASSALSATRINTPVREIPATINIVTKEFLADFGRTTVEQAVQGVSGVANRGRNEGHFQEFYMIRGFNSSLNLKNRVPYSVFTDASFVEQIEVVKGPQTVLYGLADPGGLVNIVSKKPLNVRRSEIALKLGSEDFRRLEVDTTGPALASGKLLYRLTGSLEESQSWQRFGWWEQTFVTPAVTTRPFENTMVEIEATYQRRNHAFQRPQLPQDAASTRRLYTDRYYTTITRDDDTTVNGRALEATITQRFGRHVVARATVADVHRETDMFNYVGSIAQNVTTNGVLTGYRFTPIANIEQIEGRNRHYYLDVHISDLRFAAMQHNIVVGFQQDTGRDSNYIYRLTDTPSAFNPLTPPPEVRLTITRGQLLARTDLRQGDAGTETTNRGVFVIDQVKALENRLTILGGLRRDDLAAGFKRTTPQLGSTFEVRKGLFVYGLFSESFVPNAPRFDQGLNLLRTFVPTESRGYDFGIKAELLEGRISGSVCYFNIERRNVIQAFPAVPVPPGVPQFFLSGMERSEGAELEVFYAPTAAWQFIFSYARTDARIRESNQTRDVGLQLAQTSPHSFSVTAKHTVLRGPMKGLSIGGLLIYRRGPIPAFSTFANRLLRDDSWTRLDAFFAYDARIFGAPTKISLNVNNVTDTSYFERQGMFNAPRQVFLQTRWRF